MARVLVTDEDGKKVLMNERVQRMHLRDPHAAGRLIERLAWAVDDAEAREKRPASRRRRAHRLRVA